MDVHLLYTQSPNNEDIKAAEASLKQKKHGNKNYHNIYLFNIKCKSNSCDFACNTTSMHFKRQYYFLIFNIRCIYYVTYCLRTHRCATFPHLVLTLNDFIFNCQTYFQTTFKADSWGKMCSKFMQKYS